MRHVNRDVAGAQFVQDKHGFITGRVLDVGCGQMPYRRIYWVDELNDWRPDCSVTDWVGVDVRPVGDVQSDAADMPFEDGEFDTVLAIDMLQEVPVPQVALQEMWRVLKPGGCLLVAALNTWYEDGEALWGIRQSGLHHMVDKVLGTDPVFIASGGDVMGGEKAGFVHETKFAVPIQNVVNGFLDSLSRRYPLMSYVIAKKETEDELHASA